MAYASEHAGNSDLFVQTIGESTPRQLTVSTAEESQPDWSPDGESLVFRSEAEGGGLFVVSARGGTPGKIAPSPSGKYLYFEGAAQGTASLWRITVDPKTLAWVDGPDRLTTSTTQDTDAALSPNGKRVVFSARSARTRLWRFPFDAAAGKLTGAGQPVTSGAAGELDADVPDDGSKLVYRTLRGARQQVWEGRDRRQRTAARRRGCLDADSSALVVRRAPPVLLRRRVLADGNAGEGAVAILSVDRGQESLLTRPGSGDLIPTTGRKTASGCSGAATVPSRARSASAASKSPARNRAASPFA